MKDLLPGASHLALLFDPVVPYNIVQEISESKRGGAVLNVKVTEFKAQDVEELVSRISIAVK